MHKPGAPRRYVLLHGTVRVEAQGVRVGLLEVEEGPGGTGVRPAPATHSGTAWKAGGERLSDATPESTGRRLAQH